MNKKYKVFPLHLIFMFCIIFLLSSCEDPSEIEKPDPKNPVLTLNGFLASNDPVVYTGDTVVLSWIAEKGTNSLTDFSIQLNDSYLDGWNQKEIEAIYSDIYADSLNVIMPDGEGSYSIKFTVQDSIGLSDEKTVSITAEKPPIQNTFVYYKNSSFLFAIKDGTTSKTITRMTWDVIDYDDATGIATLTRTLDPATTGIPLPEKFYFRNVVSGALEYSSDGVSWINLTDKAGDMNFLFGYKANVPSSLAGSVINKIEEKMLSYPEGISPGFEVSSEYDGSSYDRYYYSEYSKEYYCQATGFTGGIRFISDMEYFPIYSYKREVDLITYTIYLPDGTVREGGNAIPVAPSDLSGTYKSKQEIDFASMVWRTYYWVALNWTDNSDNEIQFDVYLKIDNGEFYPLSEIDDKALNPHFFTENSTSGNIEWGYRVKWPAGKYTFKLKAVGAIFESEFSNEHTITVN